jgi:hypothetical protein
MQLTFFTNTRWISSTSANHRNVVPGGYNKSSLPLINKEHYEILYGQQKLNPDWVTGFVDAEGTFAIKVIKRSKYKLGWNAEPSFSINMHSKDFPLLKQIQFFFGVGNLSISATRKSATFYVSSIKDLVNVIIPHFTKFPLITQKQADFLLFKSIVDLINNKEHLSLVGFRKIVGIRALLNKGLSDELNKAFPNIVPSIRPLVKLPENIPPNWLSGFIEGESCFYVLVAKSKLYKTGSVVQLQFGITQHNRDIELLGRIKCYFNCGRIKTRLIKPGADFFNYKLFGDWNQPYSLFTKISFTGFKKYWISRLL